MRNKLIIYIVYGLIIEVVAIFIIMFLMKLNTNIIVKYILVMASFLPLGILFYKVNKIFPLLFQFFSVVSLSVIFVIVFNIFGFFYFPGLVKDLELFSYDHLIKHSIILVLVLVFFVMILFSIKLFERIQRKIIRR